MTLFFLFICGESGIRTRDTLLAYTRFPGVPLQPLEHLSLKSMEISSERDFSENGCKLQKIFHSRSIQETKLQNLSNIYYFYHNNFNKNLFSRLGLRNKEPFNRPI